MILNLFLYGILVAVTCCDLRYKKIPDQFVIAIFLLGLTGLFLGQSPAIAERLTGCFLAPLIPVICNFYRKGSFGGGDLKLLAGCGFFLGWKIAIVGLLIAILICGLYCILGILISRVNYKTIFAFGPFISVGMILANQWGEALIRWYLT